ncbi:oxidoreductase [Terrabacter sp. Root85]|uniref:ferredoxin reductase n=1 Tax=Terrabacter sp. Root85 TaxID=1736603 RepID=UPI0006FB31FE|nr:ferredoxin reductase [Terrabacter sp. Root85]KRC88613.1 oxidoreductase [Terrabacter sp. Root85]
MARAAVPGGLSARRAWREATLVERRPETDSAVTLVLDVDGWPGHLPGQHVDVRLTAPDGYTATRSYSVSAPERGDRVELTVQRVPDGEVSTFLADGLAVGDAVRVRGPVGGWFVWRTGQPGPVLLVAGGSGVVPLMAILRARGPGAAPFRLVYSVRGPDDVIYRDELAVLAATDGVDVRLVHTRRAPDVDKRPVGRLRESDLAAPGWTGEDAPTCYVCGPTGFVEGAADLLVALGHAADRIRTERFGPSGP